MTGQNLERYPETAHLSPGSYGVGVSSPGQGGQWRKVFVRAGEQQTVTFTLTPAAPARPAAPTAPAAKTPCGKFLKRCND